MREFEIDRGGAAGTVGGGNHYVDISRMNRTGFGVGVHFGSRGLGHKTATYFLKAAGGKDGLDVPPTVVADSGPLAQDYLAAMELAGRYAYAGAKRSPVMSLGNLRAGIVEKCTTITISPGGGA